MDFKIESKYLLPMLFFLFVAIYGVFFYITNPLNKPASGTDAALDAACLLEYGKAKCIEGKLIIPFYNGGEKRITFAEITIPTIHGVDIARVQGFLEPGKTGAAKTTACDLIDDSRVLKLKWCCEKCFETEMTEPSASVSLVK